MEPRKWALLIGIDNYDRATPLRFARADVRALACSLEETCGFSSQRIRLLVDGAGSQDDVTHTGIIGALENMAGVVQPEDTFLFYFAGHGITRDDQSYLLGINTDLSSTRRVQMTSVPMAVLRDAIGAICAREKILILDACRNDPSAGRADAPNRLDQRMWDGFRDIVVTAAVPSMLEPTAAVLFACDVGQRSWEWAEKGHSVFNYYLVESLGAAAEPGGDIEFTGVASYVQRQMEEWSRQNRERPQRPIYEAKGGARLLLGRRAPLIGRAADTASTSIAVELAFWNAIANRGTPELYREYLSRYPSGLFSVIATAWLNSPPADVPKQAPQPPEAAKPEPVHKPSIDVVQKPKPPATLAPRVENPPVELLPPSPLARKLARENNVDLRALTGTGAGERITKQDLEAYMAQSTVAPPAPAPPLPAPAHPTPPAMPQAVSSSGPIQTAGPIPPSLHWGFALLLSVMSYGVFILIWVIVEVRFVKRIDPRHKISEWFVPWLLFYVAGGMLLAVALNSDYTTPAFYALAILFCLLALLFYQIGFFRMRQSLERYYTTVEPIGLKLSAPMTFYFSLVYFQYHFHRIAGRIARPVSRNAS